MSIVHPEKITVPSAVAFIGSPVLAVISTAKCFDVASNFLEILPFKGAKKTTLTLLCLFFYRENRLSRSILSLNNESSLEAFNLRRSIKRFLASYLI